MIRFLEKIQSLPLRTRKIIFWAILIILATGLIVWRFGSFQKRLGDFQLGQFIQGLNLPKIDLNQLKTNGTTTEQGETQIQEN